MGRRKAKIERVESSTSSEFDDLSRCSSSDASSGRRTRQTRKKSKDEIQQRNAKYQRKWLAKESPEKAAERKRKENERRRMREANESPEKREMRLAKMRERAKRRLETEPFEKAIHRRHKDNERRRKYYGTDPEGYAEFPDDELEKLCRDIIEDKMKKEEAGVASKYPMDEDGNVDMSREDMIQLICTDREERRQKRKEWGKFYRLEKKLTMTEDEKEQERWKKRLQQYAMEARLTEEEKQMRHQRRMERQRRYIKEAEGERLERLRKSWCKAHEKFMSKPGNKEKFSEYQQLRLLKQTPEQRAKLLQTYRINQARRNLRKKMERQGYLEEVIEKEVEALVTRMRNEPLPPASEYKPRKAFGSEVKPRGSRGKKATATEVETEEYNDYYEDDESVSQDSHEDAEETYQAFNWGGGEVIEINQDQEPKDDQTIWLKNYQIQFDPNASAEPNTVITYEQISTYSDSVEIETSDSQQVWEHYSANPEMMSHTITVPDYQVPSTSTEVSVITYAEAMPTAISINDLQLQYTTLSYICSYCTAGFPEDPELHNHIRTAHPEKCWACPKCKYLLICPKDLQDHYQAEHSKKKTETAEPDPKNTYICMKCPVITGEGRFTSGEELSKHVKKQHPESFWPCPNCKLLKYSESSRQFHLRVCNRESKNKSFKK